MSTWLIVLIVIVCLIILLAIVSETIGQFIIELLGLIVDVIISFFD